MDPAGKSLQASTGSSEASHLSTGVIIGFARCSSYNRIGYQCLKLKLGSVDGKAGK